MPNLIDVVLAAALALLALTIVRAGAMVRGALDTLDATDAAVLRSWLSQATLALLATPILAGSALALFVATSDATWFRLSHGMLVLGLWSGTGLLVVAGMALRVADVDARWIPFATVAAGGTAAMLTPIGVFTWVFGSFGIALAPFAGATVLVLTVAATIAIRTRLGAAATRPKQPRAR